MPVTVNRVCELNDKKNLMVVDNHASESILMIGGCRTTAFMNYLIEDPLFGTKYNYFCVLVYIPTIQELSDMPTEIKKQIGTCTLLISEYVQSYNYLNTTRTADKNIFQLHEFSKEVILPNWDNICLYAKDLIKYRGVHFNEMLNGSISYQNFVDELQSEHQKEKDRYVKILQKAGWHDFIPFFLSHVRTTRLEFYLSHPTNFIFLEMYRHLIKQFSDRQELPETVLEVNKTEFLKHLGPGRIDTELTVYDAHLVQIDEPYLDKAESDKYISAQLMP